jgi:hypothetical protein
MENHGRLQLPEISILVHKEKAKMVYVRRKDSLSADFEKHSGSEAR